jgi:hypothetical protein
VHLEKRTVGRIAGVSPLATMNVAVDQEDSVPVVGHVVVLLLVRDPSCDPAVLAWNDAQPCSIYSMIPHHNNNGLPNLLPFMVGVRVAILLCAWAPVRRPP